jgi:hypothetical protein
MSRPLPFQPNLEVLKKQARQLLNEHAAGESAAVARVQAVIAELPSAVAESFTLRDAQQVLAREYGFSSWQALLDHVGGGGKEDANFWAGMAGFYDELAADLAKAEHEGHLQSFGQLGREFADRIARTSAAVRDNPQTAIEQAQLAIAEHNGCDSWQALARAQDKCQQADLVNKEQFSGFARLYEEFARLVAIRFAAVAGVDTSIKGKISFVDRTTYGWIVRSFASPCCSFVGSIERLDADIVFDFGPNLALGLAPAEMADREQYLARIAQGTSMAIWRRPGSP